MKTHGLRVLRIHIGDQEWFHLSIDRRIDREIGGIRGLKIEVQRQMGWDARGNYKGALIVERH